MRTDDAFRALLLLIALDVIVATSNGPQQCTSNEDCCSLCGADSTRCLRGPCRISFVTKTVFSISMPSRKLTFLDVVNSFYGMVPYLVPMALALELIFRRRTWTRVFAFLFIPIVAMINMLVLVKSLGNCSECARPCGTCVPSMGMPSGHACNAIGLCLWILLETFLGVGQKWSLTRKTVLSVINLALFVPVPSSRVYLGDHTPLQVTIGSINGIIFAVLYFCVLRFFVGKRLNPPRRVRTISQSLPQEESKTRKCCYIENDFYVPKSSPLELSLMERPPSAEEKPLDVANDSKSV